MKCIYIDPPYNTAASEIIYKNGYKHSSWCTLLENRISLSKNLLSENGIFELAIDDMEFRNIHLISDSCFGMDNHIANIAVEHNAKGIPQVHISATHEYFLIYAKNIEKAETNDFTATDNELENKYPLQDEFGSYRELPLTRTGSEPLRTDRPFMFFPFLYKNGQLSVIPDDERKKIYIPSQDRFDDEYLISLKNKYESNGFKFILPKNSKGIYYRWKWGVESCKEGILKNELVYKNDTIYNKNRVNNKVKPKSLWSDVKYDATSKGTRLLSHLFSKKAFDYPKSIYLVTDAITIGANSDDLILDYFAGSGTTAHAVINLNREDGGKRKYILVEQGEYFDTVLKPRVQKVVYAENWKDGKPQADKESSLHGVPQIVKVLKLESYEDTLNNLVLKDNGDLFAKLNDGAKEDYLLRYMLADQSRNSLLNTDVFRRPFNYQMDIATNSAGATERMDIDLVETFNYLLGLRVHAVKDRIEKDGYLTVEGTLPDGETALVLWRDCEKVGYKGLDALLSRLKINPQDSEYGTVYINGDHNIATVWENENGVTGRLKIRQIESEFMALMFGEAQ